MGIKMKNILTINLIHLLLIAVLAIIANGCAKDQSTTPTIGTTPAHSSEWWIAYSGTTIALNALALSSTVPSDDWTAKVELIKKDIYPALVLSNSGSMALPAALNMAQENLPDKPHWQEAISSIGGIASISKNALDAATVAMGQWLGGNP